MKKIKYYIISYPLAILGSMLIVLISFCYIFNIGNIDLYAISNGWIKANLHSNLSTVLGNTSPYILKPIIVIVIFIIFMTFTRKHYSNKIYHENDNYYDSDPFLFLYVARIFGFKKINPVNIPIWIQAKIILKTNFEFTEKKLDIHDDEGKVKKINITNNLAFTEYNLIIEDTYLVKIDAIPTEKIKFPTIKIQRGYFTSGYHVYNQWLIEQCSKEIDKIITQGATRINFFCSTNPKHTFSIFGNLLARLERESDIRIYIYQPKNIHNHFIYNEPHQIH